jgi:hypothetical protein
MAAAHPGQPRRVVSRPILRRGIGGRSGSQAQSGYSDAIQKIAPPDRPIHTQALILRLVVMHSTGNSRPPEQQPTISRK